MDTVRLQRFPRQNDQDQQDPTLVEDPTADPVPSDQVGDDGSNSQEDGSNGQEDEIDDDNGSGSIGGDGGSAGGGGPGSTRRFVEFSDDAFADGNHVFRTADFPTRGPTFSWTVTGDGSRTGSDSPTLEFIHLIRFGEDDQEQTLAGNINQTFPSFENSNTKLRRQSLGSDFFDISSDETSATLQLDRFENGELSPEEIYAIMIQWHQFNGMAEGYTYSGYFSVLDSSNDSDEARRSLQDTIDDFSGSSSEGTEITFPPLPEIAPDDGSGSSGGNTAGPPTDGNDVSGSNDDDNSGGGGSGGGGGLPAGAIAGIVVGTLLGIAAIALLVFFFLRRRKRSKAQAGGYKDESQLDASNAYIADKLDAGEQQSPQARYSDDGHGQQGSVARTSHQHESDSPNGTLQDNAHHERHVPAAAAQPRSSEHDVSHLIEEGMTPEDIRRLEEEERQLDAEIERTRGARNEQEN